MAQVLVWLYGRLLYLYPRRFRVDFGAEMQSVFAQAVADECGYKLLFLFLRELRDLPGSLLDAYAAQWSRGGSMFTQDKHVPPSTRWQALAGALPFLAFGIASILGKVGRGYDIRGLNAEMAVYFMALIGLLIGWIRGFPLWSYGYLGWSLLIAGFNTNVRIYGVDWGYRVWAPLALVVALALLWTRSLVPIKRFFLGIWNDWTRLTFVMYALSVFVALAYDENHHPFLILLMAASTLIVASGAWVFLRSSRVIGRVLSILVGFIAAMVLVGISYLTWDWRAYYGLPPSDYWLDSLGVAPVGVLFWLLILFWPALIVLARRFISHRIASQ
jgi:hypothetical protein